MKRLFKHLLFIFLFIASAELCVSTVSAQIRDDLVTKKLLKEPFVRDILKSSDPNKVHGLNTFLSRIKYILGDKYIEAIDSPQFSEFLLRLRPVNMNNKNLLGEMKKLLDIEADMHSWLRGFYFMEGHDRLVLAIDALSSNGVFGGVKTDFCAAYFYENGRLDGIQDKGTELEKLSYFRKNYRSSDLFHSKGKVITPDAVIYAHGSELYNSKNKEAVTGLMSGKDAKMSPASLFIEKNDKFAVMLLGSDWKDTFGADEELAEPEELNDGNDRFINVNGGEDELDELAERVQKRFPQAKAYVKEKLWTYYIWLQEQGLLDDNDAPSFMDYNGKGKHEKLAELAKKWPTTSEAYAKYLFIDYLMDVDEADKGAVFITDDNDISDENLVNSVLNKMAYELNKYGNAKKAQNIITNQKAVATMISQLGGNNSQSIVDKLAESLKPNGSADWQNGLDDIKKNIRKISLRTNDREFMLGMLVDDPATGKQHLLIGDLLAGHEGLEKYVKKNLIPDFDDRYVLWSGELQIVNAQIEVRTANETSGFGKKTNPFLQPGDGIDNLKKFLEANPQIKERYLPRTAYVNYDAKKEHLAPGLKEASFIRHAVASYLGNIVANIGGILAPEDNLKRRSKPEAMRESQERAKEVLDAYTTAITVCPELNTEIWNEASSCFKEFLKIDPKNVQGFNTALLRKTELAAYSLGKERDVITDKAEKTGTRSVISGVRSDISIKQMNTGTKYNMLFKEADNMRGQGEKLEKADQHQAARDKWQDAVNKYTKIIESGVVWEKVAYKKLYTSRGLAYYYLGLYSEVVNDFAKAMQYGSIDFLDLAYMASASAYLGNTEKLELSRGRDIETEEYYKFYKTRGEKYFELGRYNAAINDFTAAIQYPDDNIRELYYWRGLAYAKLGEYQTTEADFAEARRQGFRGPGWTVNNVKNLSEGLRNRSIASLEPYEITILVYFGGLRAMLESDDYKEQGKALSNDLMTKFSAENNLEDMAQLRKTTADAKLYNGDEKVVYASDGKSASEVFDKLTNTEELLKTLFSEDGKYLNTFEGLLETVKKENFTPDERAKNFNRLIALSVVLTYIASEKPELIKNILPTNSDVKTIVFKVTEFGGRVFQRARNFEEKEGKTVEFSLDKTYRDEYDRYVRDIKNGSRDRY